ncbi:glycosyltransferase [uncultured Nonlabens sp.]|uniref:glycosyltransferase n=1 Tax=uncultured Nonlabens sp. TaxID=859306 RepID=UPI00262E891C|nr:glycosyltransferase [uncultured Nonlabens sp.]
MKKIKVLHVIEALGGGVYSYFTDLSKVMGNDPNLEVFVAYSDKRSEINPNKIREDFNENCNLILLDLHKDISLSKDWKGVKQIKETIEFIKPDIVHLHSSKAGILGKVALSMATHQCISYYTPHGYSFLRLDITKLKRKLFKNIEYLFTKFSKTKTIACGFTEQTMAKKMNKNARLINNGIRIDQIKYYPKTPSEKIIIGTLGRISFQKNPTFFDNLALYTPEYNFLWIGDGDMQSSITAQNIEITGWFTKRKEALPYLKKLDVYLQTSLWEGLPIAVIEAMAMGLPIIATDVIGNKDLIVHGKTGFLIKTEKDFKNAMLFLEDPKNRIEMGKEGRLRVEQYFNCETNFQELIELYLNDYSSKY